MAITTVVFDAYGTLFDVAAAARLAAAEPGRERLAALWPRLAEDWRRKQLEYTWLRSIMGQHADFAQVTADGLDWALAAQDLDDPVLRALRKTGHATAILSNGTPGMLASAVASAGIGGDLDAVLSVESVGIYKPSARVYGLVQTHFGCSRDEVLFVSSNGWDIAGASGFGFVTVWVNRAGLPQDRLAHGPAHVVPDLTSIPKLAASL